MTSVTLSNSLLSIGANAFSGCSSLRRVAIPKGIVELEDDDVFSLCDSLSEISFGGSQSEWELLLHGKALTVEKSNLTVSAPKVTFLNLGDENGGKKIEV